MQVFAIPAGCTALVAAAIKRELAWIESHSDLPEWFLTDEPPSRLTICQAAVPASALLAESRRRAEPTPAKWTKALAWALELIEDSGPIDELGIPEHDCDFFDNPEKGNCSFHEAWVDAAELVGRDDLPSDSEVPRP